MDRAAWRRIESLVDQALELDETGRSAFLESVGAKDPGLRRDLEAFLTGELAARGFLETDLEHRAPALLGALGDEGKSWDALQLEGREVGPYRLLRELGRGGMGAVFLAERADGQFEQRVALKLVKQGMDTAEILERFRSERQIQARLQHPHIARLFDGGVSASGQPYFAMEYVEGTALGLYCDQAKRSVGQRLGLFLQVCSAVEYAHHNFVVHRDIKPSNVLVTPEGQAKLLDFGIAKVLEPTLGERAVTELAERPLTPRYAAPELIVGEPVTTATDVYSLGVVLYELLSGRHPYRESWSAKEIRRWALLNQDAEPLSSALQRAEPREPPDDQPSAEEIAAARGTSVAALVRLLRGDLDKVVAMAIRREPGRRYSSVGALAADLQSFLEGRPVSARGEGLVYRAVKFVARHRLAVGAVAVLATSIAAGVVGTVWQARKAVEQARKAEEVKRFVLGLFELSDPDTAKGKELTARQLLERGAQRIESELADQPDVQSEMLLFVGTLYHRLGMNKESRPFVEKALALRRQQFAEDTLQVAEAETALGSVHFALGELEPALRLYERALQKRVRLLGEGAAATALSRGLVGRVRFEKGDLEGAEGPLRQAIGDLRRHAPATDADLAASLNTLGRVRHAKGDLDGAQGFYREALELRRRLFGDEHSAVSTSLSNLAAVMQDRGQIREATEQYRQLLAGDRRRLGSSHEDVALDLNILAAARITSADFAEAEALLRESLEIYERHGGDNPRQAMALHNLARALRGRGALAEAEASSRRALGLAAARLGEEHTNVAAVRQELAHILSARGRSDEAEELARRALATQRRQLSADHPKVASALLILGQVLRAAGRAKDAVPLLEQALEIRRRRFGEDDWRSAEASLELAECLLAAGRASEAVTRLAATGALERTFGPDHPLVARAASLRRGH